MFDELLSSLTAEGEPKPQQPAKGAAPVEPRPKPDDEMRRRLARMKADRISKPDLDHGR